MRIVVLASGRGTNFEAIARAVQEKKLSRTEIVALVSNNPDANALRIAQNFGIPSKVISSKNFRNAEGTLNRDAYDQALLGLLKILNPDFICLAGYTLLLGKSIIDTYPLRIINIHPSLLPAFKGLHAQRQAIQQGVKISGCTVHFVTEELDDGPIICQASVPVCEGDTEESLSQRILPVEHETYIEALKILGSGRYEIRGRQVILSD